MKDRYPLLQKGLFPETLPPCFTSTDLKRALSGLVSSLKQKTFHKARETDYVRYNGTKHDGSRRFFGSPNPISYFYVASFISENWGIFEERFNSSPFAVSQPRIGKDNDDRPIIIPSLSELTTIASKKLGHSAHILKADIAQFFPSIYTHSIAWSAHGIDDAKKDQNISSQNIKFNQLDFFVRNCQRGETRGVLVGPDAFRLVAEFIVSGLDKEIHRLLGSQIVGAARHVDDYYIGLSGQAQALEALSTVRDVLQKYNLNINDNKTQTLTGTEPLNDLWAQELRQDSRRLSSWYQKDDDDIILFFNKALTIARSIKSDSPVKIGLRTLDQIKIYRRPLWNILEPYIQRSMFHHAHCIDYAALLVIKRSALGQTIDRFGWGRLCIELIQRHLSLNHHHEVVWLMWVLIAANLDFPDSLVDELSKNTNSHIGAILVAAFAGNLINKRPSIKFGNKLPTTDEHWLLNLVARSTGFTAAPFTGSLASEFEHLSSKKVKMIDFKAHLKSARDFKVQAISRTRYGYDNDETPSPEWDYDEFELPSF